MASSHDSPAVCWGMTERLYASELTASELKDFRRAAQGGRKQPNVVQRQNRGMRVIGYGVDVKGEYFEVEPIK